MRKLKKKRGLKYQDGGTRDNTRVSPVPVGSLKVWEKYPRTPSPREAGNTFLNEVINPFINFGLASGTPGGGVRTGPQRLEGNDAWNYMNNQSMKNAIKREGKDIGNKIDTKAVKGTIPGKPNSVVGNMTGQNRSLINPEIRDAYGDMSTKIYEGKYPWKGGDWFDKYTGYTDIPAARRAAHMKINKQYGVKSNIKKGVDSGTMSRIDDQIGPELGIGPKNSAYPLRANSYWDWQSLPNGDFPREVLPLDYIGSNQYGGPVSTTGYRNNSPDRFNSSNVIPSGNISMHQVNFPVLGIDNLNNQKMMQPGASYQFPGTSVTEYPMAGKMAVNKGMSQMGGGTGEHLSVFPMIMKKGGGKWTGPRPWNVRVDKNDSGGLKYGGSSDDCFPDPVSFPEERKNDFLKFLRETSLDKVKESLMNEHQEFVNQFQSGGQASKDSLNHQRDKIIKYEQTRGSADGQPLPQYQDTAYYNKYWKDNVEPQLTPYNSAMEKGEAGDFIFNTGKDPKKYAYQEYLRKSSGKDWDERNSTDSLTIDSLYKNTVSKLPENDRRIMMNKGRDWYYKHINNGPNGELSPAYDNTWYGRIWNTNDYKDFDPNNPKFTPKKQYGGTPMMQDTGQQGEGFGYTVDNRSPFFDPYNNNVPLDVKKQKRRNNSPYNPPWDFIPNTGQKWQPHTDMSWMDTQQASDPNKLDYSPPQGFPQGQSFGLPPKQGAFNLDSDQYNMENVNQRASKASGEGITGRPNWKDRWWADPDLINAGMEGATSFINNLPGGAQNRLKKWQKKTTTADWWSPLTQGSRGDYTTNSGYFRPDQMTPIQFPGAAGFQHYQEGGEVYLGDSEAEQLRNQGYELQELD